MSLWSRFVAWLEFRPVEQTPAEPQYSKSFEWPLDGTVPIPNTCKQGWADIEKAPWVEESPKQDNLYFPEDFKGRGAITDTIPVRWGDGSKKGMPTTVCPVIKGDPRGVFYDLYPNDPKKAARLQAAADRKVAKQALECSRKPSKAKVPKKGTSLPKKGKQPAKARTGPYRPGKAR